MSDLTEWIKERRAIHDAATDGPWYKTPNDRILSESVQWPEGDDYDVAGGLGRDGAVVEAIHDFDGNAIADAHNTLPALLAAVEKVLELHQPVTRYSLVGYEDWSFDSFDEVREFTGEDDLPDLEEFQLCVECRRVEDGAADNTAEIGYEASLWPCDTYEAIEGAINE